MKKLLTATLAVALVFGVSSASAQQLFVSADVGGELSPVLDAGLGMTYDVVVSLDSPVGSTLAEFVMTELAVVVPGVFKTFTAKINGSTLDLGNNNAGEYIIAFGACEAPGVLEIVRVTYGNFQATPGPDTVVSLRGFQDGDSRPSSYGGEVGIVDCSDVKIAGQMGGQDGGFTGADVTFPDGAMVINPTPVVVPTEVGSMGQLKAQF